MIDAHAHLITGDMTAYPPAPPSGVLDTDTFANPMPVERLLAEMDDSSVDKAILVQRGSIYGYDSSYVCDSAARFPQRLAAVCSIDAQAADCGEAVHHWVRERGAVGIRLMEIVRSGGIDWLDSPVAREAWRAAAVLDAPVCVHLFPWNREQAIGCLLDILGEIAGLTIVLDHFAAMQSDAGPPDHGVDALLEAMARHEGVMVKFTTIPLGRLAKAGIDAEPVIKRVMDLFGAERMMWGSDITQSPGRYDEMVALGRDAVARLPASAQDAILNGTAMRIYGRQWR